MKILITNYSLRDYKGSELFTYELVRELKCRSHEVFVFSLELGKVSEDIGKLGVQVSCNIEDFQKENFDIVHIQHNPTAKIIEKYFPSTPKIFMAHGFIPRFEQPPNIAFCKYFAVSDIARDHLNKWHNIPKDRIVIIRNFIDIERFQNKKELNAKPKKLLVLSNHFTLKNQLIVAKACKEVKIDFSHIGLPNNSVQNVEDHINNYDIVITIGRGVLESLACERNVIVFDWSGGDGLITEENFYEIQRNNFSGKSFNIRFNGKSLANEIRKYDYRLGKKLRELVLKENSKEKIVDKILEEYEYCIKNKDLLQKKVKASWLSKNSTFWLIVKVYYILKDRI